MLISYTFSFAAPPIEILDRQRAQQREAPRSQQPIKIQEDDQVLPSQVGVSIPLHSLSISGCTIFTEKELLEPYKNFYGKNISFGQLKRISAEMTKKYRDAGYLLSRVIIPKQEVNEYGADIRFIAVEGYIESIDYSGNSNFLERFKNYFSEQEKKLLNKKPLKHKDFERIMLLMQDVSGVKIGSRLEQGKNPGGSILHIDIDGKFLDGNINYGSTGTEEAGPDLGSVTLGVNTLPLIGNRASITYLQAANYKEYWSIRIADKYQILNGLTFSASYAFSDSPQQDSDFAHDFDYTTNSTTWNFGISYPLIRSRDMNLYLGINYEHRNSDSFIVDDHFTKDRLRTISAFLNFDFADSWGGLTQIIPTVYKGLNIFGATDESRKATNTLAPADFWKFDLFASRTQELPYNFSLFTAADFFVSNQTLATYNKFSYGGTQFGRGYEPGVLEGDNGFAAIFEPRYTLHPTDQTSLQFFGFIDYGTYWNNESVWGTPRKEDGASAGGGIRLLGHVGSTYLPNFNLSAYIAAPLKDAGNDDAKTPRIVFQGAITF